MDVLEGDDTRRRTRVGRRATEVDDVGAERAHLRHDLALAAFAHRQHHHHRRHANDDAQQGQRGSKAIDPHHAPGGLYRVHQFGFPRAIVLGAVGQALAQVHGLQRTIRQCRCGIAVIGRVADDQAVANLDDAVGPRRHFAVVGDQDHHVALAGQFVKQSHDLGATVAVEGAGGLSARMI